MATETETATGFACGMWSEERRSAPDMYRNSLRGREGEGDDDDDAMAVAKSLLELASVIDLLLVGELLATDRALLIVDRLVGRRVLFILALCTLYWVTVQGQVSLSVCSVS
jgi:hypothetical protein